MKQYKIIVAYDGTDYVGWIQQPHESSIVQTLHDAFRHVFKKEIQLLGASKTDAGVHALGQVAVFKTDLTLDAEKMKWAWNNALPEAIIIRSLQENAQFHPHKEVVNKVYYYHISKERPLPFWARYVMQVYGTFEWSLFKDVLALFEGTHNFNAFYTGNDHTDTIRTIFSISIEPLEQYDAYRIVVTGDRFMRHMVRRIIGAALAVATRETITLEIIQKALQDGNVHYELPTASAKGLMLAQIRYKTSDEGSRDYE